VGAIACLLLGFQHASPGLGVTKGASFAGAGFGLAAGLFTCTAILGGRHMMTRGLDAFQYVALAYGATGLVLAVVAAVQGVSVPVNGPGLGYAAGVVIVGTVIPALLFYSSIRLIGAPFAALLATVEPFVAVVLSYLVLDQPLTALQLLGGALILAAVVEL
jgi:drug/metabolite transporter (DMT)-like permease